MLAPQRPQRQLSLPEELEKIEQQITLTLQEIDHNFNRAHRIVTGSIIPVVERFGNESKAVWEGCAFWKQFFETSANIVFNNVDASAEEGAEDDTAFTEDPSAPRFHGGRHNEDEDTYHNIDPELEPDHDRYRRMMQGGDSDEDDDDDDEDEQLKGKQQDDPLADLSNDSLLASLHIDQSTPRAGKQPAKWADVQSPYQKLKQEIANNTDLYDSDNDELAGPPPPPPLRTHLDQRHSHSHSTHSNGMRGPPPTTPRRGEARGKQKSYANIIPNSAVVRRGEDGQDTLSHPVIVDKSRRIQATPRGKAAPSRYRGFGSATPRRTGGTGGLFSARSKGGARGDPFATTTMRAGYRREEEEGEWQEEEDDYLSSPLGDSPVKPELATQFLDTPIRQPKLFTARKEQATGQTARPGTTSASTISSRRTAAYPPQTPSRGYPFNSRFPEPPQPHAYSVKKMADAAPANLASSKRADRSLVAAAAGGLQLDDLEDDSDDDLFRPSFSPPKTIQFSLPQRHILATPAREASRLLVRDILRTAGADESYEDSLSSAGGSAVQAGYGRSGGMGIAGSRDIDTRRLNYSSRPDGRHVSEIEEVTEYEDTHDYGGYARTHPPQQQQQQQQYHQQMGNFDDDMDMDLLEDDDFTQQQQQQQQPTGTVGTLQIQQFYNSQANVNTEQYELGAGALGGGMSVMSGWRKGTTSGLQSQQQQQQQQQPQQGSGRFGMDSPTIVRGKGIQDEPF